MDGSRLRRVIIASAVMQAAINLDFFAMSVALPEMATDLGTTVTDLQWVISGYLVALAAFFVAGGRIGDIYGRKRLLLVGVIVFTVTSVIAGAANGPTMVIVFRVLQGVGAAIAFPLSLAIVTNAFPAERVQRALGIVFGTAVIGTAAGPFLGGLLTELLSWRFVFWLNLPIGIVIVWLVITSVEESRDESAPHRVDIAGLVMIVCGVALVSFGFDKAAEWGWTSLATLGTLAGGVVVLVAFVFVEAHVRSPLLDLSLFRIREFVVLLSGGTASNIVYNTVIFGSILYLQQVRDLSPMLAGVVFLALSFGAAISGQLSGHLERLPSWLVMTAALVIGGMGTIGLSFASAWPIYLPMLALTAFGVGLGWAFTSVATQAVVPPAKAGAASGVVLTLLVGVGGITVAVAASMIETHGGSGALEETLRRLMLVSAAIALVAASAVALFGRRSSRAPAASPLAT